MKTWNKKQIQQLTLSPKDIWKAPLSELCTWTSVNPNLFQIQWRGELLRPNAHTQTQRAKGRNQLEYWKQGSVDLAVSDSVSKHLGHARRAEEDTIL